MFDNILKFFKKMVKKESQMSNSKDAAKERLHLVLLQDRANVSADFLDLMKQEIIEVIKKYIEIDENAIDVRLTNKENQDGTNGAPALYANIPIVNIKDETRKIANKEEKNKNENDVKEGKEDSKDKQEISNEHQDNIEAYKKDKKDKEQIKEERKIEEKESEKAEIEETSNKDKDDNIIKTE